MLFVVLVSRIWIIFIFLNGWNELNAKTKKIGLRSVDKFFKKMNDFGVKMSKLLDDYD